MNCNHNNDKFLATNCCAPQPECCVQGAKGDRGAQGPVGATGATGADGTSETLSLGTVYTVDSDTPASAVDTTGGPDHTWELYIPQGQDGEDGEDGADGQDGEDGQSDTLTLGSVFTVDNGTSASAVDTTGGPDHTWDLYIPQGAKGDKGDKGDTGAKGDQGCKGDKGDRGCKGDKGDRGDQGIQGERGEIGLQGIQGERGERGKTGDRGDIGIQGEKGDVGCKGDKGDTGAKGDQGERGDTGMQGERGDMGLQGNQGIQGIQGERGDQGLQGITGDKGEKGDKGDTGSKGDTGERGDQGIQGITGDKGEKGDKGDSGIQGIQGVAGPTGRTGATGAQGPAGTQGPMGCGIPGPQGDQGVAGPAGSCCDPTCTNTMSELLSDLTDKQQSVIDNNEGDETDAVVQLLVTAMLDSEDVYLSDIIMSTDNSSNLYQFSSDSLVNPLTNLVPLCDILAVCASIDSTMGLWLADYTLPGYTDSSTCPSTLDKIDFFRNYLQYCCDKGLSLTVGDNHGIDSLVDIKLLEVSNGMIKFQHPFDTPERICVMTVCDISRIYYYKQTVVD